MTGLNLDCSSVPPGNLNLSEVRVLQSNSDGGSDNVNTV